MDAEAIKSWLAETKRDRSWLAGQCGVSKPTVDGWLSAGRAIPAPAQKLIGGLMTGEGPSLNPMLPLNVFLRAQEAAARAGMTLEAWVAKLISDAVADSQAGAAADEGCPKPARNRRSG